MSRGLATGRATSRRSVSLDGERCRRLREARHMTREDLADAARGQSPISPATIKRAESGIPVAFSTARRLAELLDVDLQHISSPPSPELVELAAEPDLAETSGAGLPAALAVMPFQALGGRTEGELIGDALVEELLTIMGGSVFPVIARGSSFSYRGQPVDVRRVGRELRARYVVEGSVLIEDTRVQVTARLIDATTGHQVWGQRYQRPYRNILELQVELGQTIRSELDPVLHHEQSAVWLGAEAKLEAWELAMRGIWYLYRISREDNARARELLMRAVREDPTLPAGWYGLGRTYQREVMHQWGNTAEAQRLLEATCTEFGQHCPDDPHWHLLTGLSKVYRGKRDEAQSHLRTTIALQPSNITAHSLRGQCLSMGGQADEGIEELEQTIRLSPRDPGMAGFRLAIALSHFVAHRYDEMVSAAEQAITLEPNMTPAHAALACGHAYQGNVDLARAALARTQATSAKYTRSGLEVLMASTEPEIARRYLEGLRLAGLP